MAKGDDIQNRLIDFAVEVIKLFSRLPKTPAGTHVAGQLLRSGTSPGPHYGEVRGAETRRDFVHKLGIIFKELNESMIWLEVIRRSKMMSGDSVSPMHSECTELCKIIATSIRTASHH